MSLKHESLLVIFSLIIVFTSCKKDKSSSSIGETPGQILITEKMVVDKFITANPTFHENGNTISFLVDGEVTHLGCCLAEAGIFTVSFWDINKNLLSQAKVEVTGEAKFAYVPITPVNVTAGTQYVLSVNNKHVNGNKFYYVATKSSNENNSSIYPFTVGNVKFENRRQQYSQEPVFPNVALNYNYQLKGFADLVFTPNK